MKLRYLFLLTLPLFVGCDDDDDMIEIPNEDEVINEMIVTLTPDDGGDDVVLRFFDPDGDGDQTPTLTLDPLDNSTTYTGSITLTNTLESPAEDITAEVREENKDHRFYFLSDISDLSVTTLDPDNSGDPTGLDFELTTGAAGSGDLTIILLHEADKSEDDPELAGGETDIEVDFPIIIR